MSFANSARNDNEVLLMNHNKQIECKNCGGELKLSDDFTTLKCSYCSSLYPVSDFYSESEIEAINNSSDKSKMKKISKYFFPILFSLLVAALIIVFVVIFVFPNNSNKKSGSENIDSDSITSIPSEATDNYNVTTPSGAPITDDLIYWDNIFLKDIIPIFPKEPDEIIDNSMDSLWVYIEGINNTDFLKYVKECLNMGFNIETSNSSTTFSAYNKAGYDLNLYLKDNVLRVMLSAPTDTYELTWPINELCDILPKPKSLLGFYNDRISDTYLFIQLSNFSIEDYNCYRDECTNAGFNVGVYKTDTVFRANNKDGTELKLIYHEYGAMDISISVQNK